MVLHVYQIKNENSEKETIGQKRQLAISNALMQTACIHTTMATTLEGIFVHTLYETF